MQKTYLTNAMANCGGLVVQSGVDMPALSSLLVARKPKQAISLAVTVGAVRCRAGRTTTAPNHNFLQSIKMTSYASKNNGNINVI